MVDVFVNQGQAILDVETLAIGESGTYNDMHRRPYTARADGDVLRSLQSSTDDWKRVNPENLFKSAGQFLRPSTEAGELVGIKRGWGERRLRFMMVVKITNFDMEYRNVITGFTDMDDRSHGGHISPETKFYINNIIALRTTQRTGRHGQFNQVMVAENSQLLFDLNPVMSAETMRPKDIFQIQQSSEAVKMLDDLHDFRDSFEHQTLEPHQVDYFDTQEKPVVNHLDCRLGLNPTTPIRTTDRRNVMSPHYLSNVLTANNFARGKYNDQLHGGEEAYYESAIDYTRNHLSDNEVGESTLLATLMNNTRFMDNQAFEFSELVDLCPYVTKKITFAKRDKVQHIPNERGMTAKWTDRTQQALIANIAANTVPGMAMDCIIAKIWFTATNDTPTGKVSVKLHNEPRSFAQGIDITYNIRRFQTMVEDYLMNDLTRGGLVRLTLSVRYDAVGDMYIIVQTENDAQKEEFIAPSFCDSLFSPMLTTRHDDSVNLSNNIRTMLDVDMDDVNETYGRAARSSTQAGAWGNSSAGQVQDGSGITKGIGNLLL